MAESDYKPNIIGVTWFKMNKKYYPSFNCLKNGILKFIDNELDEEFKKKL